MFCSNCGTQLPDGTKFCNNCGAQQVAAVNPAPAQPVEPAPAAQPVYQQPVEPVQPVQPVQPAPEKPKAEKKAKKAPAKTSTRIIIAVAALLVGGLIGKFAIAPSLTSDLTTTTRTDVNNSLSDSVQQNTTSSYSASSSAYESILTNAYIVHFQPIFGMDTANFVKELENGTIICSDYGYQNDVIKKWIETIYVPVSGYSESEKAEVENTYRSNLASYDALACCDVTYSMGNNYLTITATYSDMDKQSTYSELYYAGIIEVNAPSSMQASIDGILHDGYVQK